MMRSKLGACMERRDIRRIDPFRCKMGAFHDRLLDLLDESSCRELVTSFERHGQKHPVLVRPCSDRGDYDYELVYGARRLFAARALKTMLLATITRISDRDAIVEIDIENRLRCDLSPYERAMAFRSWIHNGYFRSQFDLAETLGLSASRVSRLMKFTQIPTAVVMAFHDVREIREAWAVTLAELCKDSKRRQGMLTAARRLAKSQDKAKDPKVVFRHLTSINGFRPPKRFERRDEIVKGASGTPLFRVCCRNQDIRIVIKRENLSEVNLNRVKVLLADVLDEPTVAEPERR